MSTIVMSLGGSIIVPGEIAVDFLSKFKELILNHVEKGNKFAIVTGGGKTCRNYQNAASAVTEVASEDLDWLGIHTTRLNAHLLRTIFREQAKPKIITNPEEDINFKEKVLIGAGWKPGWSTDYVAVKIAKSIGAKKLVNLSNVDYVYDKDPKKYDDAKSIEETTWEDFRNLLPDKWSPGLHAPFDPVAAKEAEAIGLEVTILNGRDIRNLNNYLEGEEFIGTTIK